MFLFSYIQHKKLYKFCIKLNLKPISFGSHIDAVPNGGHYDGDVGVISSIEVLEVLNENKIYTDHPLELIIFSNEEGAIFGSRAIAGKIDNKTLDIITSSGFSCQFFNKSGHCVLISFSNLPSHNP